MTRFVTFLLDINVLIASIGRSHASQGGPCLVRARSRIKVGPLDNPAADFGGPHVAIFTCDKQSFQPIPEGVPAFEKMPPA